MQPVPSHCTVNIPRQFFFFSPSDSCYVIHYVKENKTKEKKMDHWSDAPIGSFSFLLGICGCFHTTEFYFLLTAYRILHTATSVLQEMEAIQNPDSHDFMVLVNSSYKTEKVPPALAFD